MLAPHRSWRLGVGLLLIGVASAAGLGMLIFQAARPTNGHQEKDSTAVSQIGAADSSPPAPRTDEAPALPAGEDEGRDEFAAQRHRMIQTHLRGRDVDDARVLAAMERVPRHEFVPEASRHLAYADHPLPIGHGQTISQPYIVALMTQLVRTKPTARALDVGTGSGYQAAILAELCQQVYSIEIVPPLAEQARLRLASLGYKNVEVRCGDGYRGWPEQAPFDVIVVAAAPEHIPQPLLDQLAVGGRLVIPVGRFYQQLILAEKQADGSIRRENVAAVAFVPMTGQAQQGKE